MRKCKYGSYDEKSQESIYRYALKLLNKSLLDLYPQEISRLEYKSNKGELGQLVEKLHFQYEPNNRPGPDFPDAHLELKTSALNKTRKGFSAKERIALGLINYNKISSETFESSSLIDKSIRLLLMFYLAEKGKNLEQVFKIIKLWELPDKDLEIIKQDWEIISNKVKNGKAHELSGADTFYLEAFRKGPGGPKDFVPQPFSKIKARPRGFALKTKYLNTIINDIGNFENVLKNDFIGRNVSFENYIEQKFKPYIGKSLNDIANELGVIYSEKKKDKVAMVSRAILGVRNTNKVEEFLKANIQMKTVTLKQSGVMPQHVSFKNINYNKIISENWENSEFYQDVIDKKFLFVVFKKDEYGKPHLIKVFFWNMPYSLREEAKKYWMDIKLKVKSKDLNSFWRIADHKYFHVRPKAENSTQLTKFADGTPAKKLCYWINKEYIENLINNKTD